MLRITNCQICAENWRINLPDIALNNGELLVLTGPSGMGKSTFLHWLLGDAIEHVKVSGQISLNDEPLDHLKVEQRHIGLLMQDVHLFPHLNVLENICFALPRNPALSSKRQRRDAAMALLNTIDMAYVAKRLPNQLSGGERARVGLLRALANQPKVLLLDEPFAALDPKTSEQVSAWAFERLQQQGVASIVVSHDLEQIPISAQHLDLARYHSYLK
ncbi:MAG: putative thiamine transport system ATP-binding protein [Paraglaciecola sp.]|jgi:putative thiamine transport system ATP-binding protein